MSVQRDLMVVTTSVTTQTPVTSACVTTVIHSVLTSSHVMVRGAPSSGK